MTEKTKHTPVFSSEITTTRKQLNNEKIINSILLDLNYKNSAVKAINGGDVHYVYKIESLQQPSFYIKIRREHFKSNQSISIDPKDIQTERKAIDLLNNCFPGIAPKILGFFEEFSAICLEDVVGENGTVSDLLVDSHPEDYKSLGSFIGKLHNSLAQEKDLIRGESEEKFYKDSLFYRLGFLNIPEVDDLVLNLYKLPKQIIHGDLTPWNIVWNKRNNSFRLYDLETMHQGNPIFDIAFLEAHIILEKFLDPNLFKTFISSFREGYQENIPITDENIEVRLAFALTLLRLRGNSTYKPRNEYDHNSLDIFCQKIISQPNSNPIVWKSI